MRYGIMHCLDFFRFSPRSPLLSALALRLPLRQPHILFDDPKKQFPPGLAVATPLAQSLETKTLSSSVSMVVCKEILAAPLVGILSKASPDAEVEP